MKQFLCQAIFQLAILLGALGVIPVQGAVIYSQTTPGEPSSAFASHSSFAPPHLIADSFSFDATHPVTLHSLRFIGGSGLVGSMSDDFRVVFLEDSGGMPGPPLVGGDYSIGPAFDRSPTGGQLLNGVATPHEYIINLPTGITLSPNVTYWISVSNNLSPVSGWGWARAGGVLDQVIATNEGALEIGPWSTFTTGGMWFELSDVNVPEPSSFILVIIAITQLVLIRCRTNRFAL